MVNCSGRYEKIITGMVGDRFDELRDKKIWVAEVPFGEVFNFRAFCLPLGFGYFIGVSKRLMSFSDNAIRGVLAHELGHAVRFECFSFFEKIKMGLYFFSKEFRWREDVSCDFIAIERGYGRGLCLFRKKVGDKEFYLKADEIEGYLAEVERK